MPGPAGRPQWTYLLWGSVGGLIGLGVLGILSIGIFILGIALLLAIFGAVHPASRTTAAVAAVPCLGIAPLAVALNNLGGPGERCQTSAGTLSCSELLSPWPFAIVGIVLVVAGGWLLWKVGRTDAAE